MTDDRPWPFEDPPELGVYVTRDVVDGAPLTQILHDSEGDWAVSGGMPWDRKENIVLVHLGWVAHTYEAMWGAAGLPPGRGISRDPRTGRWTEFDEGDVD